MGRAQGRGWNHLIELAANKPPSLHFKSDVTASSSLPAHCFPLHNFLPSFTRLRYFLTFSHLNGSRSSCEWDFSSFCLICGGWRRAACAVCVFARLCLVSLVCQLDGWASLSFPSWGAEFFFFFSPPLSVHGLFASVTKKHKGCSGEEITSKFSSPFWPFSCIPPPCPTSRY